LNHGTEETLAELIERICSHRDEAAAVPFYERCKPLVYGYIYRSFSSMQASNADDAFQGFFERLMVDGWRRLCAWRRESAASTYLIQILKNYLRDLNRRERPMEDESAIEDIGENPWDDFDNALHLDQLRHAIRETMGSLSDRDREIISRTLDDEPADQIAEAFEISTNTYYQAFHRARQRLVQQMIVEFPEFFESEAVVEIAEQVVVDAVEQVVMDAAEEVVAKTAEEVADEVENEVENEV
jgi:RNA polymerase sigma factor (sigma-70 family)